MSAVSLDISPETFELAQRIRDLRAQRHAARLELDRIDDELNLVLDQYRPLQLAAFRAFGDLLGLPETPKPAVQPLRPQPRGDAEVA